MEKQLHNRVLKTTIPKIEGMNQTEVINMINAEIKQESSSWGVDENLTFTEFMYWPFDTDNCMACSVRYSEDRYEDMFTLSANIIRIVANYYKLDEDDDGETKTE